MTCLMCTMMNPSKTLELPGELFDEGKRRLNEFLRTEMNQGLCLVSQMPLPSTSQEGNAAVSPEQVPPSNLSADKPQHFKRRRLVNTPSLPATVSKEEELKQEVQDYILMIDKGEFSQKCDVLQFWKEKLGRFSTLAPIALQYQAMPATSHQQSVFSRAVAFPAKGKKQMFLPFCLNLKLCAGLTDI
ncbi:hypothetical protein GHT06_021588 [Daphnia sinensis]|uniref:HAT C-terminal dimerisation domain-containing protein n=1 Tax=Daphnia sinensis TaxID=1820382 RepID=A0AAD5L0H3_9CRUS|nr:hypothetical protein GHT06_021588 [Daphnia sinensis]